MHDSLYICVLTQQLFQHLFDMIQIFPQQRTGVSPSSMYGKGNQEVLPRAGIGLLVMETTNAMQSLDVGEV